MMLIPQEIITSSQNPKVRQWLRLHKASERRQSGLALVEGSREVTQAIAAGHIVENLIIAPMLLNPDSKHVIATVQDKFPVTTVGAEVFARLAYRDQSDGILAVVRTQTTLLENLILGSRPLVIVLEAVEKPGNLGAILRTADAAAADAVIVCDPTTDLFNPNVIRSSLGCIFTTQVVTCTSHEALVWLRAKRIKIVAAALGALKNCYEADFKIPAAILMGTEAEGLSRFWVENADETVTIPMHGKADSLNVSVSTAILVFEALRQRFY